MSNNGVQQSLLGGGMSKGMHFGAGGLTSKDPGRPFRKQEAYNYIKPDYGMQGKKAFKYGNMFMSDSSARIMMDREIRSEGGSPDRAVTQWNAFDERYPAKRIVDEGVLDEGISSSGHKTVRVPPQESFNYREGTASPWTPPHPKTKLAPNYLQERINMKDKAKAGRIADVSLFNTLFKDTGKGASVLGPTSPSEVKRRRTAGRAQRDSAYGMPRPSQADKLGNNMFKGISKNFNALSTKSKWAFGVAGGAAALVATGTTLSSIKGSKNSPMASGIGAGIMGAGIAAALKGGGVFANSQYMPRARQFGKAIATARKAGNTARVSRLATAMGNNASVAGAKLGNTFGRMPWGKVGGIGVMAGAAVMGMGMARRATDRG